MYCDRRLKILLIGLSVRNLRNRELHYLQSVLKIFLFLKFLFVDTYLYFRQRWITHKTFLHTTGKYVDVKSGLLHEEFYLSLITSKHAKKYYSQVVLKVLIPQWVAYFGYSWTAIYCVENLTEFSKLSRGSTQLKSSQ